MRLRTSIVLLAVGLVVAIVMGTAVTVTRVLERSARRDLSSELLRGQTVFDDLEKYHESLLRAETRVISEEPRLKAVVATEEVSRETLVGVATDLKRATQTSLFLLVDGAGLLLVDLADPQARGFDLKPRKEVADALRSGDGAGMWVDGERVFQVHARRIAFGSTVVGALVTGHELDDHAAQTVERETGDSVVVMLGDKVVAASGFSGRGIERAAVGLALSKVAEEASEVDLLGARYLAAAHSFPGYRGTAPLRYVVARSIDEAMAPAREIVVTIYAIAAVAIAIGLAIALAISRRLTQPIDSLIALTREIAAGKLDGRAEPRGPAEVVTLAGAMNRMVEELLESRRNMSAKDRLQRELEIASRIQTSILPRDLRIAGFDVAAAMLPAEEVGGDYYDVIPVAGGLWVGIGDVAGHGLTAGLVMLMVQSVIAALVLESPQSEPSKIVRVLNSVLYENIRQRLANDEHVTFSLLRFGDDGRFTYAGAHEDMLLLRAGQARCERIETPGTWLGAIRDVGAATSDAQGALAVGDLLVLYTDGATEGRNEQGQQLDLDGLAEALERGGSGTAEQVRDRLLEKVVSWTSAPADDVTILVLRYLGPNAKAA